ncbi:predicted protein [Nematostella vectensis]|uniref:G-protein coupled receptors family 1 profile domain-containing protein n=1 Tax=Nematostella vectensis TaxID=45351 RepID=A7SSZ5_NEMVE|nr:predicted protein [Nematostella vectensis]|eukprot:XP_001625277.1 predicted protein [Nematostella vectensis]
MALENRKRSNTEVLMVTLIWTIISVIACVGNLLTLLIIYKNRSLWNSTNIILASLALSDFAFNTLNNLPVGAPTLASPRFPFSHLVCQYQACVCITLSTASIQILALASLNRYYRIIKPTKYNNVFSKRKTFAALLMAWCLSLAAPFLLIADGSDYVFHPAKAFCFYRLDVWLLPVVGTWIMIGIPSAVISFCYAKILIKVRHHNAQLSQSSVSAMEIKITKNLLVVIIAFVLCWTPIIAVETLDYWLQRYAMPRIIYTIYPFLSNLSSAINPPIYVALNPTFREKYKQLFRKYTGVHPA